MRGRRAEDRRKKKEERRKTNEERRIRIGETPEMVHEMRGRDAGFIAHSPFAPGQFPRKKEKVGLFSCNDGAFLPMIYKNTYILHSDLLNTATSKIIMMIIITIIMIVSNRREMEKRKKQIP